MELFERNKTILHSGPMNHSYYYSLRLSHTTGVLSSTMISINILYVTLHTSEQRALRALIIRNSIQKLFTSQEAALNSGHVSTGCACAAIRLVFPATEGTGEAARRMSPARTAMRMRPSHVLELLLFQHLAAFCVLIGFETSCNIPRDLIPQ